MNALTVPMPEADGPSGSGFRGALEGGARPGATGSNVTLVACATDWNWPMASVRSRSRAREVGKKEHGG